MKRFIASALLLALTTAAFACTSVIITGKATKDGRPLIWKNTDGGNHYVPQRVSYHDEGKYAWIGLAHPEKGTKIAWFGVNETGFTIMNTASHNLVTDPGLKEQRNNGYLMKEALDVCATARDFLNMLDTIDIEKNIKLENRVVASHYGIIDANGAAMYVEVKYELGGHPQYWVYDVNDPEVAPEGWLVYANWSKNGATDKGGGYIRHCSAEKIMAEGCKEGAFTPQWIFDKGSRSFYNSYIGIDYRALVDAGMDFRPGCLPDQDFIPRITTYVATVVQGVRKGEDPSLTTFWTAQGYPPTAVAVPAWVKGGREGLNKLLEGNPDNNYNSAMCDLSLKLKTQVFDGTQGNKFKYLNFRKLYNVEGTGYIQQLAPVEKEIFDFTEGYLEKWRKAGKVNRKDIDAVNAKVEEIISSTSVYKNDYKYEYGKIF